MRKGWWVAVFFLVRIALKGDDLHFNNIFMGDRAAGMGGAYAAIADGPEGVYYNPAGLSFSSSSYFSLSANAIQYKMLKYKGIQWDGADKKVDYTRNSFSFIPNFFGFLQKEKYFTFAFTIACLDSELFDQRDSFLLHRYGAADTPLETGLNVDFNRQYMVYEAGPSFAFLPHKQVSIGFSTLVRYTSHKLITQQTEENSGLTGTQLQNLSNYLNENIVSITNQFGVQYMPIKYVSIGYSFSLPLDLVNVYSVKKTTVSGFNDNNLTDGNSSSYQMASNYEPNQTATIVSDPLFRPTFLKQTIGIAGFITKSLVVSADLSLYIPIQKVHSDYSVMDPANERCFTWNVSTGVEWYITPNFPLRAGFFTDNANTPVIKEGRKNQQDHVNLYGGSISLGYATASMSVNVGVTVSGGVGQAQILADSTDIQELQALGVNVFLSGGYSF